MTFNLNIYLNELKSIRNELDLRKPFVEGMSLNDVFNNLDNFFGQFASIHRSKIFETSIDNTNYNKTELKAKLEFKISNLINECIDHLYLKM